jgi:hypothetical protein
VWLPCLTYFVVGCSAVRKLIFIFLVAVIEPITGEIWRSNNDNDDLMMMMMMTMMMIIIIIINLVNLKYVGKY